MRKTSRPWWHKLFWWKKGQYKFYRYKDRSWHVKSIARNLYLHDYGYSRNPAELYWNDKEHATEFDTIAKAEKMLYAKIFRTAFHIKNMLRLKELMGNRRYYKFPRDFRTDAS